MANLPKLLSAVEYGEKWGASRATVIEWCHSGKIDRCQFVGGRMWVIAHDAVRKTPIGASEMKLLNEITNIDPLTGLEKAPPPPRLGKKNYVLPTLERRRLDLGWTKADLVRASGVHRQTIARAERGIGVQAHNVWRLSYALDISVSELLKEDL